MFNETYSQEIIAGLKGVLQSPAVFNLQPIGILEMAILSATAIPSPQGDHMS